MAAPTPANSSTAFWERSIKNWKRAQKPMELETTIGYSFKDKNILKEALTHSSYLNENPSWGVPHNERLEFLGDAVLELIVTEELFNRYPELPEGQMTSIRA